MEPGTATLRDIHGLDSIPLWPVAPGWWVLLGIIGFLLLAVGIRYWWLFYGPWLNWRGEARRKLHALSRALPQEDPRVIADSLSELLRRIAMASKGRRVAAGLTGETWLLWLAEHDTSGFDWEKRGEILLRAPYMPPSMAIERSDLATLIRAATRWIDASKSREESAGAFHRRALATVLGKLGVARV